MTNKVNQALAWSVVPLPSAWCRGADIILISFNSRTLIKSIGSGTTAAKVEKVKFGGFNLGKPEKQNVVYLFTR